MVMATTPAGCKVKLKPAGWMSQIVSRQPALAAGGARGKRRPEPRIDAHAKAIA
jgi:hypothetical protein